MNIHKIYWLDNGDSCKVACFDMVGWTPDLNTCLDSGMLIFCCREYAGSVPLPVMIQRPVLTLRYWYAVACQALTICIVDQ